MGGRPGAAARADRGRLIVRQGIAAVLACLTMGCAGDAPPTTGPRTAAAITLVAGDAQQGFPRRPFGDSVRVQVTTVGGDPVSGVRITWELDPGEGSASPVIATTGLDGMAATEWTAGILPTATLRARIEARDVVAVATADVDGFALDCEPGAFAIDKGGIRAISCSATAVGDFAGAVALGTQAAPAGIEVSFASGTLDLREVDGPVGTSALVSVGNGVAAGVHTVVLRARGGDAIAIDTVLISVR